MSFQREYIKGAINTPKGFTSCGVHSGIKKDGKLDLSLILCDRTATVSGVFTKNTVKGHSLSRTMSLMKNKSAKAILINSGNANACVGKQGEKDAEEVANLLGKALGISSEEILTGSTGVIGQTLPVEKIGEGIKEAVKSLDKSLKSGENALIATMTTDTVPKSGCMKICIGKEHFHLAGMAKGSGMVHPDMATMISVITTDCKISFDLMDKALKQVMTKTFNRVSVDGETSVCDMVLMMSSNQSSIPEITDSDSPEYNFFVESLEVLCTDLAKKIAADGEGATKLIEIKVINAKTRNDAYLILQSVAKSPLVKTAIFGCDANWGRILTAVGYSGADFDPGKCNIKIGNIEVCRKGTALDFDEDKAKEILSSDTVTIKIDLDSGNFCDKIWTCDLTYDYIEINGSYRT